jgi:DNA-binding IclR family transcriptional regulator
MRDNDRTIAIAVLSAVDEKEYLPCSEVAKRANLGVSTTTAMLERFSTLVEWKVAVVASNSGKYPKPRQIYVYRSKPGLRAAVDAMKAYRHG